MKIHACRLCGNPVRECLDIGSMALAGFFPQTKEEAVKELPLMLCSCDTCHLVQLCHDFDLDELYGINYGYCSSLNNSMVNHLDDIRQFLEKQVSLEAGDVVVDIGSNDGTLLNQYQDRTVKYYGIDPTAHKFIENHKADITVLGSFFDGDVFKEVCPEKVKIVSTISMFYDLPSPLKFSQEVCDILHDDGVWFMEHSYLVSMIENMAYDTICHEHVEYYSLRPILYIAHECGLKVVNISLNDTNGGSFALLLAKNSNSRFVECTEKIEKILEKEEKFFNDETFKNFEQQIKERSSHIVDTLEALIEEGNVIHGYGASTKGNIVLQYCNITETLIPHIAEVNEYKFGRYTPGTKIPIISESESRAMEPDYYFVLPWHYKTNILRKEKEFIKAGTKFIFPFPEFEIIDKENV